MTASVGLVWATDDMMEKIESDDDESVDLWKQKSETYMEMMDAIASDADKACALLRWAETEMRYAGWGTRINDQHVRTDVYEAIVDYLYGNSNDIA